MSALVLRSVPSGRRRTTSILEGAPSSAVKRGRSRTPRPRATNASSMMRRRRGIVRSYNLRVFVVRLLLFCGALGLVACSRKQDATPDAAADAAPITITPADAGPLEDKAYVSVAPEEAKR